MKRFHIWRKLILGPVIVALAFTLPHPLMVGIQVFLGLSYFGMGVVELIDP